ncbi:type IV secretion protein Rhs [Pilimelia terevasa]|uniref:Type IV secretion protein Rhs n=2 Tax=Pilimelia terevasa TaxID=53372 RepID=A0A8J3BRL4_9ACTN|nr:type IV secretion protein Rhs [Pilimelia terevasa]
MASAGPDVEERRPKTQDVSPIPVKPDPLRPGLEEAGRPQHSDFIAGREIGNAVWPTAGVVEVPVGGDARSARAASVGGLPIRVWTPPGAQAAPPGKVRVEVLGQDVSERAGVTGVLFKVTRADGGGEAADVVVDINYDGFSHAVGGDWASRLGMIEVPACVADPTPAPGCAGGEDVEVRHNADARTVTATVAVQPTTGLAQGRMLLMAAGGSGAGGTYAATSLTPAGSWQLGGNTGSFSWQYPMRVPPALAGPSPQLTLSYSSAAVDGKTGSSNAQPSWVGEGMDLSVGFIERSYKACKDDGHDDKGKERYDLCWAGDHLNMSFGGRNGELVKKSANEWRLKSDDGTRIQRRTDGFNGDDNKEYFVVTTTDGTRYFFGRGKRAKNDPENLRSAWKVPVFGDDKGEPCYNKGDDFNDRRCSQIWRWNLDYVIDGNGNTSTYFWNTESNRYATNRDNKEIVGYDRGGWLGRIEYGERAGADLKSAAPMVVEFDTAERCIGATGCAEKDLTDKTRQRWPDVPFDQICKADAKECKYQWSPSFFTRKRLTKVTTSVLEAGKKRLVDTWELAQELPDPGDGSGAGLWLKSVTHIGGAGKDAIKLPPTVFEPIFLSNRVDSDTDDRYPYRKPRLAAIQTESGGITGITYKSPECRFGDKRDAKRNTGLCHPSYWSKQGTVGEKADWFHKYVIERVTEDGRAGSTNQTGSKVTSYSYGGGAAWHYDDNELSKKKNKTWSQFRGFTTVTTVTGDANATPLKQTSTYLRGMSGDKDRGEIKAKASDGTEVDDDDRLQGFLFEQRTFNGDTEVSGSVHTPWVSKPTATEGADKAALMGPARTVTRTALDGGKSRRTAITHHYDAYGMIDHAHDQGDTGGDGKNSGAAAEDDSCTRYTYNRNTAKNLITLVSRVETVAVACGAEVKRPDQVVSDVRTFYDGATNLTTVPTRGTITRSEEVADYKAGKPVYQTVTENRYDAYGRVIRSYDAKKRLTRSDYIPASGGPVTGMKVTNPAGHTLVSTVDPAWGEVTATVDANNQRTSLRRDPLGRLTAVWLPGRDTTNTPDTEYQYLVRANEPVAIITKTLTASDQQHVSYQLFDAMLRPRQEQKQSAHGKRVITDTVYDSRGLAVRKIGPYLAAGPPAGTLAFSAAANLAATTVTTFDGAGRSTKETFQYRGQEKWTTTTSHHGDHAVVDPPTGETAIATFTNAQGQTTELWEYRTPAPTGKREDADVTRYSYDHADRLTGVRDQTGHQWTFGYDLRGRRTTSIDPDTGTSITRYDSADQIIEATDARKRTLTYRYDSIGRPTAVLEGDTPLVTRRYDDTAVANSKGRPTSATRHHGGKAYTTAVSAYDAAGRPLRNTITIPDGEGALGKTYEFAATYTASGNSRTTSLPAAGGLKSETVKTNYDLKSALPSVTSADGSYQNIYVRQSVYSEFGEPLQYELGAVEEGTKYTWLTYNYEADTRRLRGAQVDRYLVPTADSVANYRYDSAGNILSIADTPKGANPDVQCFTYDHLRRLTEAWAQDKAECATKPTKDVLGGPAAYWQSFGYDSAGNRTSQTDHAAGSQTETVTRTHQPFGPGRNPAHAVEKADITTAADNGRSKSQATFAYDPAGNMTRRNVGDSTQTIDWDAEGHAAKITDKNGKATSFVYDADGNRLIRRDEQNQTVTLYQGGQELRLDTRTGTVSGTRYYTHNGQTVAIRTEQGISFLAGGQNGTSEMAVNANDLNLTRQRTKPFGETRGPDTPLPGERGFIGGTNDKHLNLVHLGAREYDPATGRFISPDPLMDFSDPQQLNAYSYGRNNPFSFADPTGMWWGQNWNWNAIGHGTLDVIGLVPVVGEVGDIANGAWYSAQGDKVNAALSFASAIPVAGYAATAIKGAKWANKGIDAANAVNKADKATDAGRSAAKVSDKTTPPAAPAPKAAPKPAPAAKAKAEAGGGKSANKSTTASGGKAAADNGGKQAGHAGRQGGQKALPAAQREAPNSGHIISRNAEPGEEFNMVLSAGQSSSKPGGFGTFQNIPSQSFARNDLAIRSDWKPDVSVVQRYRIPKGEPIRIQESVVGRQMDPKLGELAGGGGQVEIINFIDRARLIPVGPRVPLK